MMEDLKNGNMSYTMVGEFLSDLKEEFDGGDDETMKVVELKKIEQENRTMKEFVQKFRRAVKCDGYRERILVEEFKRDINGVIWQKLIKLECHSRNIKQWYEWTTNLNRYQRESKQEKERLRDRREIGAPAQKTNIQVATSRTQGQQLSQPKVWPRRQEIPQQYAVLALIEGVERMNIVVIHLQ